MERMWRIARVLRPSIYGRPKKSLFSKYFVGHEGDYETFAKFFRKFVKKEKPGQRIGKSELCRLISSNGFTAFTTICGTHFHRILAGTLLVRDLYLEYENPDQTKATEFALNFSKVNIEDCPFVRPQEIEEVSSNIGCHIGNGEKTPMIEHKLKYFIPREEKREVESNFYVDCCILEKLADGLEDRFGKGRSSFEHPILVPKLVAVLDNNLHSSFFVQLKEGDIRFTPFAHQEISYINGVDIPGGNKISVRMIYPWEADELEKAEVIAGRGVNISKPLGRLFINDIEFGLFEWIPGRTLDKLKDPAVWEAYGRVVRFCHEQGIALDDAAGRNAVWTGQEIRLIDLEHTWLAEEARKLPYRQRAPALQRIKNETQGHKELTDAFMRGYRSNKRPPVVPHFPMDLA